MRVIVLGLIGSFVIGALVACGEPEGHKPILRTCRDPNGCTKEKRSNATEDEGDAVSAPADVTSRQSLPAADVAGGPAPAPAATPMPAPEAEEEGEPEPKPAKPPEATPAAPPPAAVGCVGIPKNGDPCPDQSKQRRCVEGPSAGCWYEQICYERAGALVWGNVDGHPYDSQATCAANL